MKLVTLLLAALLALAACGQDRSADTVDARVPDTTATTSATTTSQTASTSTSVAPDQVEDVDLATYVAALEDALAETAYAGEVLKAPEVFLATGILFCDRLDSGLTPDEVMTQYVETLMNGPVERAEDDDLVLAGGVLGVGVVTLCPHHLDILADSS